MLLNVDMFWAICSMKFGISNYRFVIVLCTRTNQWKSLNIDLQRYTQLRAYFENRKYDISHHPETEQRHVFNISSGTSPHMTFSGEKMDFAIHVKKKQCFVGIGWTLATVCTVSSTINVPNIFTQFISLFEIVQMFSTMKISSSFSFLAEGNLA